MGEDERPFSNKVAKEEEERQIQLGLKG
ncbi:hypothetical protein A4157S3_540026 [Escherichia coli]|nr:hypothetical protein A4157S1_80151 [Escherichia coli]SOQ73898.1 hypothetical protein A4157S3_540026 [Escherichia coli]SOQ84022.1 hypothetical protein DSM301R_690028 [Escherichia coli]